MNAINLDLLYCDGELCVQSFTMRSHESMQNLDIISRWLYAHYKNVYESYVSAKKAFAEGESVSCIMHCRNIITGIFSSQKSEQKKWLDGLKKACHQDKYINNLEANQIIKIQYNQNSGVDRRDALTHVCQEFVDETTMIEFEGDETDDNIDVLRRRPIYVGGFTYNESLHVYQRNGRCRLLGKRDGICSETENGVKLVNGWYVARDSGESLRMAVVPLMAADGFEAFLANPSSAEELEIPAGRWKMQPAMSYELVALPRLRLLKIRTQNSLLCERFIVQSLPELEEIVVEKANGEMEGKPAETFLVAFCDKLAKIVIGDGTFRCYDRCELRGLRALRSVSFGSDSFVDTKEFLLEGGRFIGVRK